MPTRALNEVEKAKLSRNGISVDPNMVIDEAGNITTAPTPPAPPELQNTDQDKYRGSDYEKYQQSALNQGPVGFVKRQVTANALPTAAGGLGGAATGALIGGLGGGPVGMFLGGLAGGAISGYGAKKVQDEVLRSYADANPKSETAAFVNTTEEDIKKHPYAAMTSALAAAPFAGGLPSVKNIAAYPGRALVSGGAQAGINAATQLKSTGSIDPAELGLSFIGGLPFGGRNAPPTSAMARNPEAGLNTMRGGKAPATTSYLHQSPDFNMENILSLSPKELNTIANTAGGGAKSRFYKALADVSAQMPLKPSDVERISVEGATKGYGPVAADVITKNAPEMIARREQKIEEPAVAAGEKASQEEAANLAKTQEQIDAAKAATQANEAPKSAQESAAIINAKSKTAPTDAINVFRKEESDINKLITHAEQYPEGSPIRDDLVRIANTRRAAAEKALQENLSSAAKIVPEQPVAAGTEEIKAPRELGEVEPPEETPPVEEAPLPVETPPQNTPPIAPTEQQQAKEFLEKLSTKLPATKQQLAEQGIRLPEKPGSPEAYRLKVAPTEKQLETGTIKTGGPTEAFSDALGLMTSDGEGQRARNMLREHAAAVGQKLDSVDKIRAFYNSLPSGDRLLMANQYKAGAEHYVNKLPAAKQAKKVSERVSQAGKKMAVPKGYKPQVETTSALPEQPAQAPKPEQPKGLQVKVAQEQAQQKGGQSGSIPNPFRGKLGDYAEEIVNKVKKVSKAVNPIEFLSESEHALAPSFQVAAKAHETLGPRFAKAANDREIIAQQIFNRNRLVADEAGMNKLSNEQAIKVGDYMTEMKYHGKSDIELTPEEQRAADFAFQWFRDVLPENAPYVKELINGKMVERPQDRRANYVPEIVSDKAWKTLRGENSPEKSALEAAQIQHNLNYGSGIPEVAEKQFTDRFAPSSNASGFSPEFAGLRKPEGPGIAPELRERNIYKIMMKYNQRISHDLANFHTMESDPQLAKGLGYETNGRGEKLPETVLDDNGNPIRAGMLNQNQGIRDVNQEYSSVLDPNAREFEKIRGVVTTPLLGATSRIRHSMIALNSLREYMTPEENAHFGTALKEVAKDFAGVKREAQEAGAMRLGRNANPALIEDALDTVSNTLDKYSRYTGAEAVAEAGMTYNYAVSRLLTASRMANGDSAFFDRFGPRTWRESGTPEEIIRHTAANLTRQNWGTYTGQDLPHFLARGSTSVGWAPFLVLARAPIGRFNTWKVNVYDQAKAGNITPLIHSALGALATAGIVNYVKQLITDRKPQELTWAEYLKLGGKDTANTLFSKLATAGYGGVLSELAEYAIQYAHGEAFQGFNSPTFITEENIITRLGQWAAAFSRGESDLSGLGKAALELTKDQFQIFRQLYTKADRGMREERLARHIGYLPPAPPETEMKKASPFSPEQAYLRGDVNQARKIVSAKIARGQTVQAPDSEIRQQYVRSPSGAWKGYYDFINEAQGPEAARAAMRRDIENTNKKMQTFTSALTGR